VSTSNRLTENDIQRWTDSGSYHRGYGYFQDGTILNPRRQNNVLKAQCWGSMPQPYHVQVTLDAQGGIASGTCSCPVGYACKHTVALLLTWIHEPEAFVEAEAVEANLEKRTKAELIALILKMLDRDPDLEALLEIQMLGDLPATERIDPEVIEKQVTRIMHSGGHEWGSGYAIAQDVTEVIATGDGFAEREDWRNAATVYSTVAKTVLDDYESVYDDEGEVLAPVNDCVDGLERCLAAVTDDVLRESILRALFDVYRWDTNYGGVGVSDNVPSIIFDQTTPAEKEHIVSWIRGIVPSGDALSSNWQRQHYGWLLLELQAEKLDDEAYLRTCREFGLTHTEIDRLLDLGRVEEATATARGLQDYDLLNIAASFTSRGHEHVIHRLILERAGTSQDRRLTQWLKQYAQDHNDPQQALALAETLFWAQPSLAGYQELQTLGQPLQRWTTLREDILQRLKEDQRYSSLRIEIYLGEGEVKLALETLAEAESSRTPGWGWYGAKPMRVRVAEAAEKEFPYQAIDIYMQVVFDLVGARGRQNYTSAATYLLRVRDLYRRLGDPARFTSLVQNLRDANKRLRALNEELKKVGL
jgi:uncharacterized Zn finger protein